GDDVREVSERVGTIAATGEELTVSINEISGQVHKSTATTDAASIEASNVRKVAQTLTESAQKVSGIVGLINSIASKINLLSLNATIEAARAGEAGKGFAVVASEVKALANQTSAATAEIGSLVTAIQGSSEQTLTAITQITGVIDQMTQVSSAIAAAVEEQGVATREIVENIVKASTRMSDVTRNASMVTTTAEQSAAAAIQTQQASADLSRQAEVLRGEVGGFLGKLIKG
ncbi:MAG: hypothetical protein EBR02_07790, partial [Alphaproteobacteria bacterium]|nr:hypothetical protein [Alphaproteobacteria bacterium]